MIKLIHGDCLEEMKKIPDGSIDLVLTDPPYGLEFMGKDWDKGVPGVHFWVEMLRVLKPGGYLLSFSGTRTYHRMGTAIEDAGFEVRDMIEWVYGSGFPKSLNIGKAVDKLQGNEREKVSSYRTGEGANFKYSGSGVEQLHEAEAKEIDVTKGTSAWEGWGTALKPAHEPICMARKPIAEKTVAENVLKYGTGGINIDESRVDVADNEKEHFEKEWDREQSMSAELGGVAMNKGLKAVSLRDNVPSGRFPANLIHDGSDEVKECFPEQKSGARSSKHEIGNEDGEMFNHGICGKYKAKNYDDAPAESGNASRFFKSIIYQAKASKSGRGEGNNHPTVKPVALMEYLAKMCSTEGATILDPFMGSGTTGVACKNLNRNFIGIELDKEYFEIAKKRINEI